MPFWLSADAIDAWNPPPSGRRGAQRKFSDHAIETALTLRLVFGRPRRQRVAAETTIEVSRLHDPEGEADRTPPMEEGIRLPSTGAGGERLLPVQVDYR